MAAVHVSLVSSMRLGLEKRSDTLQTMDFLSQRTLRPSQPKLNPDLFERHATHVISLRMSGHSLDSKDMVGCLPVYETHTGGHKLFGDLTHLRRNAIILDGPYIEAGQEQFSFEIKRYLLASALLVIETVVSDSVLSTPVFCFVDPDDTETQLLMSTWGAEEIPWPLTWQLRASQLLRGIPCPSIWKATSDTIHFAAAEMLSWQQRGPDAGHRAITSGSRPRVLHVQPDIEWLNTARSIIELINDSAQRARIADLPT